MTQMFFRQKTLDNTTPSLITTQMSKEVLQLNDPNVFSAKTLDNTTPSLITTIYDVF